MTYRLSLLPRLSVVPRAGLAALALLAATTLSTPDAHAVPCTVNMVTAEGSPANACQNGVAGNDQLGSPLTVNQELFFGFNDWVFLAKRDDDGTSSGLTVTGIGTLSGTWSVTPGTFTPFENFMIVLKAGNEFDGFLFDNAAADDGTWSYDMSPDLSHLSVYVRGDAPMSDIPEPVALSVLGLGLTAFGLLRRRRT